MFPYEVHESWNLTAAKEHHEACAIILPFFPGSRTRRRQVRAVSQLRYEFSDYDLDDGFAAHRGYLSSPTLTGLAARLGWQIDMDGHDSRLKNREELAPRARFELATLRLTANMFDS